VMWPLYDLCIHGEADSLRNCASNIDTGTGVLTLKATRTINPGDMLYLPYYSNGDVSNYVALENWGFATPLVSLETKITRLELTVQESIEAMSATGVAVKTTEYLNNISFLLPATARPAESESFLGYLRHLAQGGDVLEPTVHCGGHTAPDCAGCPQGNGASWCNGDCKWQNEDCVRSEDASTFRYAASKTTWEQELLSFRIGLRFMERALGRYTTSIAEDEALLEKGGFSDPRIQYMVILRRDEKEVLTWWAKYFRLTSRIRDHTNFRTGHREEL